MSANNRKEGISETCLILVTRGAHTLLADQSLLREGNLLVDPESCSRFHISSNNDSFQTQRNTESGQVYECCVNLDVRLPVVQDEMKLSLAQWSECECEICGEIVGSCPDEHQSKL